MMNIAKRPVWGFALAVLLAAGTQIARGDGQPQTIKGYVLDSACAFTKGLTKPISSQCAVACAKAGSPLVILTEDGTIYWPISAAPPAQGQNARLLPFAGKKVSATGRIYQRGGSKAVVIASIEAEK